MNVLLLHNPGSGEGDVGTGELIGRIGALGHDVEHVATDDEGWRSALRRPVDLVVAAGGDGTVRDALLAMPDDGHAAITVLALGTANNIARTLGLPVDDPFSWIEGWPCGVERRFDIPVVTTPNGSRRFVESFGGGVFATAIATDEDQDEDDREADDLAGRRRLVQRTLARAPAGLWRVVIDGEDHSGWYVSVEALNIERAGPAVLLAPGADPGDGQLDVVVVGTEERDAVVRHIDDHLEDEWARPLPLRTVRGRRLVLQAPEGTHLRIDDELYEAPPGEELRPELVVTAGAHHRRVLVPG